MKNKFIIWTAMATFSWLGVNAQSDDREAIKRLEQGVNAYEQERYAAAYQHFAAVQGRRAELNDVNREMLDYYHCLTSFELGKGDAIDRIESFRKNYPESPFVTSLDWIYANVKFDQKNYTKAL
jgi:TolA-binding protein